MRSLLLVLALATVAADRPNVIIILADDLGAHDLGCYGSKFHRTPNIDQLAAAGVRFTAAYAAAPVCSPTRAALLTGQHPARLGITDWLPGRNVDASQRLIAPPLTMQLATDIATLPRLFKAAGYRTGHIGKWHLGGEGFGPLQHGFDSNIAGDHTGTPLSYFAPFVANGRTMPGLEKADAGEYLTDRLSLEATKFIDANRDRPFFLYLAHYAPHTPLKAKDEVIKKYPDTKKPGQQSNRVYAAMLESIDDGVGAIVKKLKEHGLDKKTVLVFASDNGGLSVQPANNPATSNAPLREGKGYLYEGGLRIPLIVKAPGVAAATPGTPVMMTDVLPTLADWCKLEKPGIVDGVSLAGLLRGQAPPERPALYWHYPHYWFPGVRPGGAVRHGDLKYIEYYDSDRRELFNLKNDPSESRNLYAAGDPECNRMAERLSRWRGDVGAKMMTPSQRYLPNPRGEDGSILLHSRFADVHGTQLRYEPAPHKSTLGYWTNVADTASWEVTVSTLGQYRVEILIGCAKGQEGSTVAVEFQDQSITFTVPDTGGFQSFKPLDVGVMTLQPGRHTLTLRPKTKAKSAIMDVREVRLRVGT